MRLKLKFVKPLLTVKCNVGLKQNKTRVQRNRH